MTAQAIVERDEEEAIRPQQQLPRSSSSTQHHTARPPLGPIPMVRKQLRRVAGDLFSPQAVVIGPYHQREGSSCPFPWTEDQKTAAVRRVRELLKTLARFDDLVRLVHDLAPLMRRCYTHWPLDSPEMDMEFFSRMLLRDGCYLLRLFVNLGGQSVEADDITVERDTLYLVENQIPLLVLERMLEHITRDSVQGPLSAVSHIALVVKNVLQEQLYISGDSSETGTTPFPESVYSATHLLHLVYSYFRRTDEGPATLQRQGQGRRRWRSLALVLTGWWHRGRRRSPICRTGRWRRATEYSRHGDVRFVRRAVQPDEEWSILDISYDDDDRGTLCIPLLRVDGSTWTMLRNLMALEELRVMEERPVTAYCFFMSQLACTAEDVQLLQRAKILEHFMGSDEEAAKGFADLCKGVALDIDDDKRNYLKKTWHDLEKRCASCLNNFRGIFRDKYWASVFNRFVFLFAAIVFLCQVSQTTYTVLAYHKPAQITTSSDPTQNG